MNPELFNMYVNRLLKEIEELTKHKLLVETQLQFTESLNRELNAKVVALEEQETKSKKINKKEVDTSSF